MRTIIIYDAKNKNKTWEVDVATTQNRNQYITSRIDFYWVLNRVKTKKQNYHYRKNQMNLVKIDIIINWLNLVNVKNVQSFLKLVNFYKRFIYDYSKLIVSLTRLIKKNIFFEWFSKCQIIFNVLKKIFISNIIFRHYDLSFKIVMKINVSNYVFENVLSQYDKEKIFYFVIYFSKKHFSIECNYEIYDKKLLIIVRAFEKWRSKLKIFIYLVDVIINHKNLKFFASIKKLNRRQVRWNEFFFEFNFRIIYRSKTIDDKLNVLTRRSNDFFKKKNILNSRHQF